MTDPGSAPSNVISMAEWSRKREMRSVEETYERLLRDEVAGLEQATARQMLEDVHIAAARARLRVQSL